jgi:type I restriction enzyme S subunit
MNRYDSYKNSGVEWMNEIPSNWEKSRIRMVGDLYGGLTGKKGSDFNDDDNPSNKPFVPFTNIFNNTYISRDHFQYVNVEEDENQNRVLKNDLFFLMSSESYEDLGKCSILLEDVEELYLNSFCKGFRIKDSKVYSLFLNYQLLGSLHKEMISIEGNGFTRINLRQDRLLDIPVFIPPLSEQQQIVSFLDTKTSLIDSLIEKTQQKIELLKEKRTSLINEVVTKGLNPNVEMKDSGVEWIGEIPSGWFCVGTNKVYHDLGTGTTPTSDNTEYYDEVEGNHWITTTDLNEGIMYDTLTKITDKSLEDYPNLRLYPSGSIYISMYGGRIGKLGVSTFESYCNQSVCVLPKNEKINVKFYYYWFLGFQDFVKNMGRGGGQPNINKDMIKQFPTVKIPLSEQNEIVSYLDEQTGLIDKTISVEERRIELLKEYRQSLISEVVTGKRKVV